MQPLPRQEMQQRMQLLEDQANPRLQQWAHGVYDMIDADEDGMVSRVEFCEFLAFSGDPFCSTTAAAAAGCDIHFQVCLRCGGD